MYIGKYYGKKDDNYLDSGISYISHKIRSASKRSIKFMISSTEIKNSEMRMWRFNKYSYNRIYRFIIMKLLNHKIGDYNEAIQLLHDLYISNKCNDNGIEKIFSDILVSEQKNILIWSCDKPQYANNQSYIIKIINHFMECDQKYNYHLK